MSETDIDLDNKIIETYRKLSPERKQQFIDFVDFLIWREEKRKANLNPVKDDDDKSPIFENKYRKKKR